MIYKDRLATMHLWKSCKRNFSLDFSQNFSQNFSFFSGMSDSYIKNGKKIPGKKPPERVRLGFGFFFSGFFPSSLFCNLQDIVILSVKMHSAHKVLRSWTGVRPIFTKVNVANRTSKTVTFQTTIRNTREHCRIASHRKWVTSFLFNNTVDTKIPIITTKA